ncbi:MAG: Uncharacterised protein [Methanobacteriota archaeon]|nr:MAG: Uncharacterised protein [Euryarchaeota archaeon]
METEPSPTDIALIVSSSSTSSFGFTAAGSEDSKIGNKPSTFNPSLLSA